jgi:hypothetical protein
VSLPLDRMVMRKGAVNSVEMVAEWQRRVCAMLWVVMMNGGQIGPPLRGV